MSSDRSFMVNGPGREGKVVRRAGAKKVREPAVFMSGLDTACEWVSKDAEATVGCTYSVGQICFWLWVMTWFQEMTACF